MRKKRKRPFSSNGSRPPSIDEAEAKERLWRARVAEAAKRAADDLRSAHDPRAGRLVEDLDDLYTWLNADGVGPSEQDE